MAPGLQALQGRSEHIKSHQLDEDPDLIGRVGSELKHHLLGNQVADSFVKMGLDMHPALDEELLRIDSFAARVARQVLRLAARILGLHPERPLHRRRAPPSEAPPVTVGGEDDQSAPFGDDLVGDNPDGGPRLYLGQQQPELSFRHDWIRVKGQMGSWRCMACM